MFGLFISKEKLIPSFNEKELRVESLKVDLINAFDFKNSLRLVCIHKDLKCFVSIDGIIQKDSAFNTLFEEVPSVYRYSPNFEIKSFGILELDEYRVEEVFFDFRIDKDYKIEDMVLFYKDQYYLYNALDLEAKVVKTQEEITEMFDKRFEEIKDAFSI